MERHAGRFHPSAGTAQLRAVAERDLAEGRPWIAADRLRTVLDLDPADAETRVLLGDALLLLGEHRAAGRVLALCERSDPAATRSIECWLRDLGDAARPTRRALRQLAPAMQLSEAARLGPVATARLGTRLGLAREALRTHYALAPDAGDLQARCEPPPSPPGRSRVRRWLGRSGWTTFAALCAIGATEVAGWVGLG